MIPVPTGSAFSWAINNPEALPDAVKILNGFLGLTVRFSPGIGATSPIGLTETDGRFTLTLPISFQDRVSDITTTVGVPVVTTAPNTSSFGYTTQAQAAAIVTNVNALRVDVLNIAVALNLLCAQLRLTGQNPSPIG